MDDVRVHTTTLIADLRLPLASGLKERRKELHGLLERLRSEGFAVARVGPADLHQRVFLAIADVSGTPSRLAERLEEAERMLFASDFEVASLQYSESSWTDSSLR